MREIHGFEVVTSEEEYIQGRKLMDSHTHAVDQSRKEEGGRTSLAPKELGTIPRSPEGSSKDEAKKPTAGQAVPHPRAAAVSQQRRASAKSSGGCRPGPRGGREKDLPMKTEDVHMYHLPREKHWEDVHSNVGKTNLEPSNTGEHRIL